MRLQVTHKYTLVITSNILRNSTSGNSLVSKMPDVASFTVVLSQQIFLFEVTRNANFDFIIENILSSLGSESYSRQISYFTSCISSYLKPDYSPLFRCRKAG